MALCTHFTQNAWRKDLCANCFKSRGEHGGGGGGGAAGAGGAPRYLSSVCASRWRSLADGPLQAKAPLQGILRARAAATSALPTHASATAAAPRRRAANGSAGNSVRFSADQPQVIGEGGGDWPSDDEHNEEENGMWSNGRSNDGSSGSSSSGDDDMEEEDEEARALQRLTRTNTHLNAAPPEKESAATTNGIAEGASPRRPLALGRPLTGADGQRRAPLLVAVTPFGAEERSSSRIPVAARSRPNGAGAAGAATAAGAAAAATGTSPARDKRRKEEENERQLRRKNSAEVNIEHVTTSESTTDDSLTSAIPAPKGATKASSNGPSANASNTTPSITNGTNTHTPITNGFNTHTPITNGPKTNTALTNGPNTLTPIINGTKSSITDCPSASNSFIKGPSANTPITDSSSTNTSITSDLNKGTPPVVTNVKNCINAPRQVVGEDAPTAVGVSKQQQLAALTVEDVKRPEQLLGTPATAAPTEIITARAEPALAKMTGDLTPPLKDVDKDAVDGRNGGEGDLARPEPDGRADPEGGPSEPPSAPAITAATPTPTPTATPASGPPPGIDPRPSFLHSRLPRGAASGSAGTLPPPTTANGKPAVPAKPEVRLGSAPGQSTIAARQASELARSSAAIAVASSSEGKEKEKPSAVASISSHWSCASSSPATPAATPTACIPVLIPTVPTCNANAASAEGVARTPKRPAPRPPPPCATLTSAPASEVEENAVSFLEEKKEDEELQVMKEGNNEDVEKATGEEKRAEERTVERPTSLNIIPQPQPVLQSQPPQPQPLQDLPPSPPSPPPPLVPVQQYSTPTSLSASTTPSVTPVPTTPSCVVPVTPDHRPQKAPKPKFSLRKLLRFGGRGSGGSGAGGTGGGKGLMEGNGGVEGQGNGTGGGTGPHAIIPTRTRPEIVHPLELRGSPERVDTPPRRSPQEPLYVNGGLVNAYNAGRPAQPPPPPRAPASSPPSSIASTPTLTPNASCLQTPPPASGGARPIRPPPPRTNSLPGAAPGPRQPPPRTCGMMAVTAVGPDCGGSNAAADGLYANLGEARSALAPHKPQRSGSLREAPGGCSTGSGDSDPGYEQVLNGPPRPVSDSGDSTNEPVYERVRAHPVPAAYVNGGGGRVFSRSASLPACCGPLVDALQGLDPEAAFYASCSQPHSVGSNGGVGTRGGRLASRPALHRSLEDAYGAVVGANHEALAHALERVTLSLGAAPPSLSPAVLRALRSAADSGALRFGHFRPTLQSTWHTTDAGGRRWTRAVWDAQGGASPPCEVLLCVGAPGRGGLRAPALGARGLAHAALAPLVEFAATPEELPSVLRTSSPTASSTTPDSQHTTQPNRTDTVWVSVLGPARVQCLQDYGQMLQATAGPAGRRAAALALLQLVNALKALQARGQEEAVVSGFVVMLPADDASGSSSPPPSQPVPSSSCLEGVESQGGGGAAVAAVGSESGARVVALPEAALVGGGAGAATQSLCACVDAGLRALLPPSAPLSAPLHALLQQERADSLSRAQAALEFALWGPAPSPAAADEEEALQRWLDLERASELRALVDALTATSATAAAATGDGSQGHATGPVPSAVGGSAAATGVTGSPRAASVAERCRLWFLVRTSARALVDAARLLRTEHALEASES